MSWNIKKETFGTLCALGSGLAFSLIGYFGVMIQQDNMNVPNMLFWRFFIASIFMFFFMIGRTIYKLDTFIWDSKIIKTILLGATTYGLSSMAYFYGSHYLGTGVAMVIFFTFPAIVIAINKFVHKTTIHKLYYLAVSIILIGLILLIDLNEITFDMLGIFLSLLSGLLYALYVVFSKGKKSKGVSQTSLYQSTLWVTVGCTLANLLFLLLAERTSIIIPTLLTTWFAIIAMGVVSTCLPILLLLYGLKYISSEKASLMAVLEPVFVVILGVIFLDEKVTLIQYAGIGIILAGALMTLRIK